MTKLFEPYNDEENGGMLSVLIPATLVKIPAATRTLDNEKATPYGLATCHIEYPDNTTDEVQAIMWGASIETGLFQEGTTIVLRTQLEGEYAGNAVVQLPAAKKVDIGKFNFVVAGKKVEASI